MTGSNRAAHDAKANHPPPPPPPHQMLFSHCETAMGCLQVYQSSVCSLLLRSQCLHCVCVVGHACSMCAQPFMLGRCMFHISKFLQAHCTHRTFDLPCPPIGGIARFQHYTCRCMSVLAAYMDAIKCTANNASHPMYGKVRMLSSLYCTATTDVRSPGLGMLCKQSADQSQSPD
jgi:hypothetical protein